MPRIVCGRRPIGALVCALAVLAGCDDPTVPAPLAAIREARVDADAGPIFRTVELTLDREAAVEVEYGREGSPRLRVVAPAALRHAVLLPRLHASSTYRYEARTVAADGRRGPVAAGQFTTGALPDELARIELRATGTLGMPLVLLIIIGSAGEFSGYVAVDADGAVVWYHATPAPSGITRTADGTFVFISSGGLFEMTPAGVVRAGLPSAPPGGRFHHDVIATRGGRVLAIANDTQTVAGTHFTGEAIWEWQPATGELRRRWSAFDFLDPFRDRGSRFSEANWMHANSLARGSRGNVILSSNNLNQVLSIAPDFGSIEWRLGGPNATITTAADERFSGQHTAAELEDGHILIFDNRREQGGYSRAVEFALAGGRAEKAWEWRPQPDNFSPVVSSARRLPGGSTLIAFGTSAGVLEAIGVTEVYEVAGDGAVLWHLSVTGALVILYRAEPLSDIAGEVVVGLP